MKKVSESPTIMLAPPRSADQPYWVALLKNLFGLFSSHANAINLLYENIEDDTEYQLPWTHDGNLIYFQKFASFAGPNGSPGTPAIAFKAHGISNLDMTGYRVTHFEKYNSGGFGKWERTGTNPYTGNLETVWVDPTNLTWHTNYDARALTMTVVLEYQKT